MLYLGLGKHGIGAIGYLYGHAFIYPPCLERTVIHAATYLTRVTEYITVHGKVHKSGEHIIAELRRQGTVIGSCIDIGAILMQLIGELFMLRKECRQHKGGISRHVRREGIPAGG